MSGLLQGTVMEALDDEARSVEPVDDGREPDRAELRLLARHGLTGPTTNAPDDDPWLTAVVAIGTVEADGEPPF